MSLEVRVEPTKESRLEGPEGVVATVWGLVYEDDAARAVYYVRWRESRPEPVEMIVSIGEWGDGSDASARDCIAALGQVHEGRFSLMLIDAGGSSFAGSSFLGAMREASAVRGTPLAKKVFHFLDHVMLEDERVVVLRESLEV